GYATKELEQANIETPRVQRCREHGLECSRARCRNIGVNSVDSVANATLEVLRHAPSAHDPVHPRPKLARLRLGCLQHRQVQVRRRCTLERKLLHVAHDTDNLERVGGWIGHLDEPSHGAAWPMALRERSADYRHSPSLAVIERREV